MTGNSYRVVWEIDITAPTAMHAAALARTYQLDPNAEVGVFEVFPDGGNEIYRVDLDAGECETIR